MNIAASSLATGVLLSWFGDVGVIYATVIMTIVVVVFSEIIPKTAAFNAPDRGALLVARPMQFVVRIVRADVDGDRGFRALGAAVLRHEGRREPGDPFAARGIARRGRSAAPQGGVEKLDRDMVGGMLDLRELEVSDVMIHRTEMATVNVDSGRRDRARHAGDAAHAPAALARPSGKHRRHAALKDVLRDLQAAAGDASKIDIPAIMTPPWFVPDTTPLAEQLKAFRRRKTRFALVVDEYGQVMGLVTLDDIIGEIIGDSTASTTSTFRACARNSTARFTPTGRCRSAISTAPWTGACPTRRRPRSPAS